MRTVITRRNAGTFSFVPAGPASGGQVPDTYRERLRKYIPAEIVALYIAVYGIVYWAASADPLFPAASRWILIGGFVAVPLYLWLAEGVGDLVQLAISTFGFLLWAFALGVEPLSSLPGYNQIACSLALPTWVFLSPLIDGVPERW